MITCDSNNYRYLYLMQPIEKKLTCDNPKKLFGKGAGFHDLHYMEWGDKSAEKTVICVHGLTHNSRFFDHIACELSTKGYRVICPDIVGRGKSDWLSNPKLYGYPLYVSDMVALLTNLKLSNIDWIGTSMGGLIGMMVETTLPHVINKMVLNDIGPFIPATALNRIGEYVGQSQTFPNKESAIKYLKNSMNDLGINEESHWQHLTEHRFAENEDGTWSFNYDPAIAHPFRKKSGKQKMLPDLDLWKMWQMIHCPMLVLRGAESDLLQKDTALKMATRDNVDLVEIENVGHAPMLMDEHQIKIITDWLIA